MVHRIFWKFQPKRMFLSRDIEFSRKPDFCDLFVASDYFLEIQYLEKETLFLAETFRIFYGPLDLSTSKISGRNSVIWFFGKYLGMGWKFSKTVITWFQRPMGTNSFRLLLVSPRSTCEHNMELNSVWQLEMFPRKRVNITVFSSHLFSIKTVPL